MKHAGAAALDSLEPLLERLRAMPDLREKTRGVFYRKGRACLHFHEDPSGLWADIRLTGEPDFTRLPADGASAQAAIIARLATTTVPPDQHLNPDLETDI